MRFLRTTRLNRLRRRRLPQIVACAVLGLAACDRAPTPDLSACDWQADGLPAGVMPVEALPVGAHGHGYFGTWQAGPWGLPEYDYTLDQANDPRADWTNTERRTRRDHWHLVGNLRLNALAYNEGWIEVFTQERGHEALVRHDVANRNFGGGWSWIVDDPEGESRSWSSAWAWRPEPSRTQRRFGMGYVRYGTCDGRLAVERTVLAPAGDHRFLIEEIELRNLGDEAREVLHASVWDVNRHYIQSQLLRSGTISRGVPSEGDAARDALNEKFEQWAERETGAARIRHELAAGPSTQTVDRPAMENLRPPDVFLAALDDGTDRFVTDGRSLWSDADRPQPQAWDDTPLPRVSAAGQPAVLVAQRRVRIPAGGSVTLRYAFGQTDPGAPLPDFTAFRDPVAAMQTHLAETVAHLPALQVDQPEQDGRGPDADSLARELAWHAWTLRNMGGYQEYYRRFIVNQGSAYWWLHGLDGAVRDYVFIAVALAWIDPALAREVLLYAVQMRFGETGAMAYTASDLGRISDAGIHTHPSDLDLFLWWGLAEYVAATGDASILAESEPFWPRPEFSARPLREHIEVGLRYLVDEIGVGHQGLIRVGSGDWDDSINFFAPDRDAAERDGESVANAAMAVFIAPWAAALMDSEGRPEVADELDALAAEQQVALENQWVGRWYRRAWFGPGLPFGDDVIFLFSNALALIAGSPDASRGPALANALDEYLIAPSTTSMFQFWFLEKPVREIPGATDPGASNPIISALGVWGLSQVDPAAAWSGFIRNTMARKAEIYPDIWYGIWSGADAQYTNVHPEAGQTWASPATPMKDFPVLNSNQHAGPLIGALRLAGLEPAAVTDAEGRRRLGMRVGPRVPAGQPFRLMLPQIQVETTTDGYRVELAPVRSGARFLQLHPPPGRTGISELQVDGRSVPPPASGVLRLDVRAGDRHVVEVGG